MSYVKAVLFRTNRHLPHRYSSSVLSLTPDTPRCPCVKLENINMATGHSFVSPCMVMCVCVLHDCVSTSTVLNGYRLKAAPQQDSVNIRYYIEKELSQFPSVKMASLKRKPAQIGPAPFVCVAVYYSP